MALIVTFLLGIANFALHRAVIESGHPLLDGLAEEGVSMAPRLLLAAEFVILLGAMLLAQAGQIIWVWGYGVYSAANALSAWLIISRRI